MVGLEKDLGENTGAFTGPIGKDDFPNELSSGWRYWSGKTWNDAISNEIIFTDICKL